jgi:hypothetical protein
MIHCNMLTDILLVLSKYCRRDLEFNPELHEYLSLAYTRLYRKERIHISSLHAMEYITMLSVTNYVASNDAVTG